MPNVCVIPTCMRVAFRHHRQAVNAARAAALLLLLPDALPPHPTPLQVVFPWPTDKPAMFYVQLGSEEISVSGRGRGRAAGAGRACAALTAGWAACCCTGGAMVIRHMERFSVDVSSTSPPSLPNVQEPRTSTGPRRRQWKRSSRSCSSLVRARTWQRVGQQGQRRQRLAPQSAASCPCPPLNRNARLPVLTPHRRHPLANRHHHALRRAARARGDDHGAQRPAAADPVR